jgi:preprotein translocase subunit SecB
MNTITGPNIDLNSYVGMTYSFLRKILPEIVEIRTTNNLVIDEIDFDKQRLNVIVDKNNKVSKVLGYY